MTSHQVSKRFIVASVAMMLAIGVLIAVCTSDGVPSHLPCLVVVTDARDVHFDTLYGTKQVRYELHEKYPAQATLKEISNRLAEQEWKPLQEDFLGPERPSSHEEGWSFFVDGTITPEEGVRQWLASWTNARGDVVTYCLQYRFPPDTTPFGFPGKNTKLLVYGILTPAKIADEQRRGVSSPG